MKSPCLRAWTSVLLFALASPACFTAMLWSHAVPDRRMAETIGAMRAYRATDGGAHLWLWLTPTTTLDLHSINAAFPIDAEWIEVTADGAPERFEALLDSASKLSAAPPLQLRIIDDPRDQPPRFRLAADSADGPDTPFVGEFRELELQDLLQGVDCAAHTVMAWPDAIGEPIRLTLSFVRVHGGHDFETNIARVVFTPVVVAGDLVLLPLELVGVLILPHLMH